MESKSKPSRHEKSHMPTDAIIALEQLRCNRQRDAEGIQNIAISATPLLRIDDSPGLSPSDTPMLVEVAVPGHGDERVVIKNDMHACRTADLLPTVGMLRVRFEEEGLAIRRLILAMKMTMGTALALFATLTVSGCSSNRSPSGTVAAAAANLDGARPVEVAPALPTDTILNKYRVKVTFDSMTVHDTHEGIFSGDGEYDIAAYVQGTKIGLTNASEPGDGLWDISEEETVNFRAGTELSIAISPPTPLVIFTVGSEVDKCGRTDFYSSTWKWLFGSAAHGPTLLDNVTKIQDELNYHSQFGWHESGPTCKHDDGLNYPLNKNDILGLIKKIYGPPGYGAGAHTNVTSSNGDFTLRYTIVATPPPVVSENVQ